MRLCPASSAAAAKLANDRVTPGKSSVVSEKLVGPNTASSTVLAAPLNVLCPDVYVGKFGVTSNGTHVASGVVAALLSWPASRIAVIGRHRLYWYLQSQATMPASASARSNSANSRAFCTSVLPRSRAMCCAIWFQCPGGVAVPAPAAQYSAICVWSAVRTVLSLRPKSLTSFNAAAYSALSSVGGAAGRNWPPPVIVNGVTCGQFGNSAGSPANSSGGGFGLGRGVGTQSPGL